ncbi:ribosome-associated translation inhibitor RaiA [Clostridium sp. D2Q-14]|uniref:ribosome hibernation-promoting factor, HPF/YfiA family n=1 Tax=Anaeromonas gelatinilytica TaxID=2683194 RepID=UPI00193BA935|nr:ribosome-associated translation inhibitor RaiA [Anaeromonas gelatinilytica]MBS4535769.1 ribosome-associated translation inhibitor RaiA [Anaeromonas gelatinilytica]
MDIIISGKNMQVTEGLRETVNRKLDKLDKFFQKGARVKVTMTVEKNRQIIEVSVPFSSAIIRAEEETEDMYTSIDKVVDLLERQIRKHKTKLERRKNNGRTIRFENIPEYKEDEDDEPKIVKTKKFAMKPMDDEEAILQMELLGHNFFVYKHADTNETNVIYKRKDGNYGLIEPEI